MKTDSEIERDVKAELGWNPDLKSTDIAISVKVLSPWLGLCPAT